MRPFLPWYLWCLLISITLFCHLKLCSFACFTVFFITVSCRSWYQYPIRVWFLINLWSPSYLFRIRKLISVACSWIQDRNLCNHIMRTNLIQRRHIETLNIMIPNTTSPRIRMFYFENETEFCQVSLMSAWYSLSSRSFWARYCLSFLIHCEYQSLGNVDKFYLYCQLLIFNWARLAAR